MKSNNIWFPIILCLIAVAYANCAVDTPDEHAQPHETNKSHPLAPEKFENYNVVTAGKYRVLYFLNGRLWARQDTNLIGHLDPKKMEKMPGHESVEPKDTDEFMVGSFF